MAHLTTTGIFLAVAGALIIGHLVNTAIITPIVIRTGIEEIINPKTAKF